MTNVVKLEDAKRDRAALWAAGSPRLLVAVALCCALGFAALYFGRPHAVLDTVAIIPPPPPTSTSISIQVVDGDTIRTLDGKPDVRLVGFNAPETVRARCAAEREKGLAATRRLVDLVAKARIVAIDYVPCSCPPGTEGTRSCNYGRRCGVLRIDGADVGPRLISEGLAVPFVCGGTKCPPTPRPWC